MTGAWERWRGSFSLWNHGKWLLGLAIVAYWCVRTARQASASLENDFGVYYRAGEALWAESPIYELSHGPLLTFKYAPVVALLWSPLSFMPADLARALWCFLDLIFLALLIQSAMSLAGADSWSARGRGLLAGGIVLLTLGSLVAQLQSGQSTSLWLLLVVLSFEAMTHDRPGRAGVMLAGAVCLKCVPLAVAPYLLFTKRPRRGVLAFVVGLGALLLAPALAVGWNQNLAYVLEWPRHLRETITYDQMTRPENQSVLAQYARWLIDAGAEPTRAMILAQEMWLASVLLVGGLVYLVLSRVPRQATPAAHLSVLLLFMTAFNPLAWRYNFVALVVPYAYVLSALLCQNMISDGRWGMVLGAAMLNTFPWPTVVMEHGGRLWGMGLLASAVMITLYSSRGASAHTRRLADRSMGSAFEAWLRRPWMKSTEGNAAWPGNS